MSAARDGQGHPATTLLVAMIATGGLLTLITFARYFDHGALVHDVLRLVGLTAG